MLCLPLPPCQPADLGTSWSQGTSVLSNSPRPFSCLWGSQITDLGKPGCFSEPWERKPSGSELLGLLVPLGFAKACDSCLTLLLSLPQIPLPPTPQVWCHQCWHSDSQLWNTGQWLHQSWVRWAIFSSLGTVGTMPPSQRRLTILYAMD